VYEIETIINKSKKNRYKYKINQTKVVKCTAVGLFYTLCYKMLKFMEIKLKNIKKNTNDVEMFNILSEDILKIYSVIGDEIVDIDINSYSGDFAIVLENDTKEGILSFLNKINKSGIFGENIFRFTEINNDDLPLSDIISEMIDCDYGGCGFIDIAYEGKDYSYMINDIINDKFNNVKKNILLFHYDN
jgi:hypothetical protein